MNKAEKAVLAFKRANKYRDKVACYNYFWDKFGLKHGQKMPPEYIKAIDNFYD